MVNRHLATSSWDWELVDAAASRHKPHSILSSLPRTERRGPCALAYVQGRTWPGGRGRVANVCVGRLESVDIHTEIYTPLVFTEYSLYSNTSPM